MQKQEEILNEQVGNTLTPGTGEQIIEREEIPNTPFTIIKKTNEDGNKTQFLTIGQYRLSPDLNEKENMDDWIYENMWNLIISLTFVTVDLDKKIPSILNNINKNQNG